MSDWPATLAEGRRPVLRETFFYRVIVWPSGDVLDWFDTLSEALDFVRDRYAVNQTWQDFTIAAVSAVGGDHEEVEWLSGEALISAALEGR